MYLNNPGAEIFGVPLNKYNFGAKGTTWYGTTSLAKVPSSTSHALPALWQVPCLPSAEELGFMDPSTQWLNKFIRAYLPSACAPWESAVASAKGLLRSG